jgi:hypothetical protein
MVTLGASVSSTLAWASRTDVLQSVRGNERLEEVADLKEAGTALAVVPRHYRIDTLKWARGLLAGASVLVGWRRVSAFGREPAVTT